MRFRSTAVVVLLTLSACGSSTAASTAGTTSSRTCGPRSARTLASSGVARVYVLSRSVYGCAVGFHRSYRLGATARSIREGRVGPLAVAGKDAAYGLTNFGVDTISAQVIVRSLADGRQLHAAPAISATHLPESFDSVDSIVVKADGAVAWIAQTSSVFGSGAVTFEVHRIDARGQSLLDAGHSIRPRSLRLSGSTVSWRAGSSVRTAVLR